MSTEQIIAGFIVSTVGFSLIVFGKKQQRVPQLVVGMLMMATPFLVRDPVWMSATAAGLLVGMRVAISYTD